MTPTWKVLVLFGASGTGKSTAAAGIGRRCNVTWVQVDDLRLAMQFSNVTLPQRNEEFYFFERTPDVWTRTPAELRQAFIAVAELMLPALRTVIHSHVLTDAPMVIEGDGVLPTLAGDPLLQPLVASGAIRFCCIESPGVKDLYRNLVDRGRGIDPSFPHKHQRQAEANHAFGLWLEAQARECGVRVVPSCPFETLVDRILQAIE